ncbi:DUF2357 domain-containing protein [Clostridium estertheticum]|uniref:DUF2357 domain-containing protein n=1 Tax=Clostridium estertheticum TaxID=238834 RepID=UPI001C0AD675|nr:DUF2357 domain-containing protein [Clostridium estertheticum]MBU3187438.1 DUF2357 domain-containing protein [Clostridium estertheticum]
MRNKVTPTGRGGNILSGIINFRGDIGYSDLYGKVNGNIHMKIIIEVLSSKIDYYNLHYVINAMISKGLKPTAPSAGATFKLGDANTTVF